MCLCVCVCARAHLSARSFCMDSLQHICVFLSPTAFVAASFEGPSLVGGGCSSSLACRLCMLPVSCWEQIAQAAGAVSASRLTCTASWLAAAQQYGTRDRHEDEIELLRCRELHLFRRRWGYYQLEQDALNCLVISRRRHTRILARYWFEILMKY